LISFEKVGWPSSNNFCLQNLSEFYSKILLVFLATIKKKEDRQCTTLFYRKVWYGK
jgi:hypothetical protein